MALVQIYGFTILLNTIITVLICLVSIILSALYARTKTDEAQDNFAFVSNVWIGTRSGIANCLLWLWMPLLFAMALDQPLRSLATLAPSPMQA